MRYYKFEYGCDNKEVGSQYPQVWDFIKGYSPENEDTGVFSLYYNNNPLFPIKNPDLSGLKLSSGAHYTDFLSNGFSSNLFILNERVKDLLVSMNIETHHFYKAKIISLRKKMEKDYYVLKMVSENWRDLDFPNSTFHEGLFDDITPVSIKSYDDFCQRYNNSNSSEVKEWNHYIFADKIKMLERFSKKNLDLFQIDRVDFSWYVSERFVDGYYKNKFTGLEFEPVDI